MAHVSGVLLVLVLGAALLPLDVVPSGQGYDRARSHDRGILRLLACGVAALLVWHLLAGAVAALGLLSVWRDGEPRLLLWAVLLGAVWAVAPALALGAPLIGLAWLVLGALEALLMLWALGVLRGWWRGRRTLARWGLRPLAGLHGQHTLFAASVALLLPLAASLGVIPALLGGALLVGVSSWVGIAAGLVGVTWAVPAVWPLTAALVVVWALCLLPRLVWQRAGPLNVLPRGDHFATVLGRWHTWRLMAQLMRRWPLRTWLLGAGWPALSRDLLRAWTLRQLPTAQGTAHNDVLEVLYANGLVGAAVLGLLAWRVGHGLVLGDPWSGVVLAGVVVALGSSALHYPAVGLPWWLACAWVAT